MPGFITIRPEGLDDDKLDGWVQDAVARAALLPPKQDISPSLIQCGRLWLHVAAS